MSQVKTRLILTLKGLNKSGRGINLGPFSPLGVHCQKPLASVVRRLRVGTLGLAVFFFVFAAWAAGAPAWAGDVRPRVISLDAGHTEMLLRLGAEENIIGVSGQETYQGPETEGWVTPPVFSTHDEAWKFLKAKPDLVLVDRLHMAAGQELWQTLKRSGIKVYSFEVVEVADLYKYWRDLGALVGRGKEAEALIIDFDHQISAYYQAANLRPEGERPGIFIEALYGPIKTFTPSSLPAWLVGLGGGRYVAAEAKAAAPGQIMADFGPERLLAKAKDIDIYISLTWPLNQIPLAKVKKRRLYKKVKAFQNGRVYKISADILARPTPSLLKGLEEIAALTGLEIDPTTAAPEGGSPPVSKP